jgi:hypothetical protein
MRLNKLQFLLDELKFDSLPIMPLSLQIGSWEKESEEAEGDF